MVEIIPRVKLNEPSLLGVHQGLGIGTVLVAIQDLISPITCKPNKTFYHIESVGGVHAFLQFHGTIILSTIMKDELLASLKDEDYLRIISVLKPDFCLTVDCETYEGESYWKLENGIKKLFFDGHDVSQKNIMRSASRTLQFMHFLPNQKFIGLVKGSTREQIIQHTNFFRAIGIRHMALHTADFFRNGSPSMVARAKLYAQLIRKEADTLTLMGFGSQNRLLEFSFADNYCTFGYFVAARNGKKFARTKKIDSGGYSPEIVRMNLVEMIKNIKEIDLQNKLIIGGESSWEVVPQVQELYIQAMPEQEVIMLL